MPSEKKSSTGHEFRITNLSSFEEVTEEPRQIAGLYFYQMLDCLVELAYFVSFDFRKRPQLYRELEQASIVAALAELNAQYGTRINFLSREQRTAIFWPIFGGGNSGLSNTSDSFSNLRDGLIQAATAFAQRVADTGVEALREGVRTAHRPFKDYLVGLHGDSVRFSKEKALADLTEKICYPILRSRAVAAVFGIAKKSAVEYPYATDPSEDVLVEEISKQLGSSDTIQANITRESISNLQRAALHGAEAIAVSIRFEEAHSSEADLDLLITRCYTWGTALASLKTPLKIASTDQTTTPSAVTSIKAPAGYGR